MSLLNQEILEFLDLSDQACGWSTAILSHIGSIAVQLDPLRDYQSLEISILFLEEVVFSRQASAFFLELVNLRCEVLGSLFLLVLASVGINLGNLHVGLDDSFLRHG